MDLLNCTRREAPHALLTRFVKAALRALFFCFGVALLATTGCDERPAASAPATAPSAEAGPVGARQSGEAGIAAAPVYQGDAQRRRGGPGAGDRQTQGPRDWWCIPDLPNRQTSTGADVSTGDQGQIVAADDDVGNCILTPPTS